MRYYRIDDEVEKLSFKNDNSTYFDLKAHLTDKLVSYSPYHREAKVPIKVKDGKKYIILQPQYRLEMYTGLIFSIPVKYHLRVTPAKQFALQYGVTMLNGFEMFDNDFSDEISITLFNTSDTPVHIYEGDVIANAVLNKVLEYTLDETNRKVAFKTFSKKEDEKTKDEDE